MFLDEKKMIEENETKYSVMVLLGAAESGTVQLTEMGIEFQFKNPHLGLNFCLEWNAIKSVELTIKLNGRVYRRFAIVSSTRTILLECEEAGKLLKAIRERVGNNKFVQTKSLLDPFKHFMNLTHNKN